MSASASLDLGAAFGSLAAVHAALDAIGHGRPCAIAAWFTGRSADELHAAVAAAQSRYPILGRRLAWDHRGRAVPTAPVSVAAANAGVAAADILAFTATATGGGVWRYGVRAGAGGTWFLAGFLHAAADGISMLRLLDAINAALGGQDADISPRAPRSCLRRTPYFAWLPRFALGQLHRYVDVSPRAQASPGGTWLVVPPREADHLMRNAADAGAGFAAWLAAATALAVCRRLARRQSARVHLNIPVWRDEIAGGFGFGVSSLLLGVRIRRGDEVAALAPRIDRRLRQAIDRGWDLNLLRFLGDNPRRYRRFARLQASPAVSRSISVSWKGRFDNLGGADGPRHVGCFGTTPTLHVSGHADANGLSLSITSAHAADVRAALLLDIAELIGAGRAHRVFDLARLAEGDQ